MSRVVFVTGGARSGKSAYAQRLAEEAAAGEPVTFVATAQAFDDEMRDRISRHQADRPAHWPLLEAPLDVAAALRGAGGGVVLLDCLSLLVSNLMLAERPEEEVLRGVRDLLDTARARRLHLVVVTNEVGSGVVPPSVLGRVYRDVLGRANQLAAAAADEAHLVVAGLPLRLK